MSISLQGSHRCIERNTECDCPICGDYLFTSPETVVFMPCGHSIHQKCYNQHIKTFALSRSRSLPNIFSSYRCPTCSRALVNMDHYFLLLDMEVRRQPMPAPYDRWQTVILWSDSLHFALLTVLVTIARPKVGFLFILSATSATCKFAFVLMF
jgi:hypothetical protein